MTDHEFAVDLRAAHNEFLANSGIGPGRSSADADRAYKRMLALERVIAHRIGAVYGSDIDVNAVHRWVNAQLPAGPRVPRATSGARRSRAHATTPHRHHHGRAR